MADVGIPRGAKPDTRCPRGAKPDARLRLMIKELESLAPRLSGPASREASSRLNALQRILVYRAIETYDPADRNGFSDVVGALSDKVSDSSALADLFGVSVSTLYRWKSGESVPQKLARAAVKEYLLKVLDATPDSLDSPPASQRPAAN